MPEIGSQLESVPFSPQFGDALDEPGEFKLESPGRFVIMSCLTTSFRDLVSTVIDYHYDDPLLLLKDPEQDPFAAKYATDTIAVMEGRERGDWIGPDLK